MFTSLFLPLPHYTIVYVKFLLVPSKKAPPLSESLFCPPLHLLFSAMPTLSTMENTKSDSQDFVEIHRLDLEPDVPQNVTMTDVQHWPLTTGSRHSHPPLLFQDVPISGPPQKDLDSYSKIAVLFTLPRMPLVFQIVLWNRCSAHFALSNLRLT